MGTVGKNKLTFFGIVVFVVVFQCHHMSLMDFVVSLLVVAEV
jgi:hypothetical protein